MLSSSINTGLWSEYTLFPIFELTNIDNHIACEPHNSSGLHDRRKLVKQQLDDLYHEKAIGAQVRSRAKWVESGEHNTSYFLNLEKRHQNYNNIDALKEENKTYDKDKDILRIASNFYQQLYASRDPNITDINTYLQQINFNNCLNNDEREKCEGKLLLNECEFVLNKMKLNKSPGLDGLPL
jgi:hypothetical protein